MLVWRRPWMTQRADTYGASVLAHLGWATPASAATERYPVTDLAVVGALAPDLVVLPSEPYPFRDRHRAEVATAIPGARTVLVDGHDLFWWGIRTPSALTRLAAELGDPAPPVVRVRWCEQGLVRRKGDRHTVGPHPDGIAVVRSHAPH